MTSADDNANAPTTSVPPVQTTPIQTNQPSDGGAIPTPEVKPQYMQSENLQAELKARSESLEITVAGLNAKQDALKVAHATRINNIQSSTTVLVEDLTKDYEERMGEIADELADAESALDMVSKAIG